ncbi:SDR family oxidoreductase [Paucihalobacter ruber]|uniref:SDR family oxidoreductase n=1 Tax=Paucihalobacter ruber TaxID=2567861 RepID=A0A506PL88_9FLAO|nr:SDR family oxidoreductase [Paucihalobacter ruber]TPV33877.1 SDR family oxidoreductase [Paucihalobacter ruber]
MISRYTALVTGGASGIGFELARLFARDGHHLILVDMNQPKLCEAKHAIENECPEIKVYILNCNLARENAAEFVYNHVTTHRFNISFLVNNAGFGVYGCFAETPWQKEMCMLQLHVLTVTALTKLFLPGMITAGYGRILNVASVAAFQPGPLMAVYYASKSYILSFSQAIANELHTTGVSITTLCPGITATGFQKSVGNGESKVTPNSVLCSHPADVALSGYKALMKGKSLVIPGMVNRTLLFVNWLVPRSLSMSIIRKAQEKIHPNAVLGN